MNLEKVYTKFGVQSSPLSLFRKFDVFYTFSVIFVFSDYRKCIRKDSGFLKSNKGLLCTPDLVCSFFKLVSYIF